MVVESGDRTQRHAGKMFVAALALVCGACGGGRHHDQPSGGNASAGTGGKRSASGGSSGSADPGAVVAGAGDVDDAGASNQGGRSGQGGAEGGERGGVAPEMAGDGPTESGGTSAGGVNSEGTGAWGGTSSGGTSSGGSDFGGADALGGTSSGGANAGGTEAAAGSNLGGINSAAGVHAGGASAQGGSSAAGAASGGATSSCGDAVLGSAEECDDGNSENLDGCSATCKYEIVDRMTAISVQGGSAPAFCTPNTNALGRAFSSTALTQLNTALQQSISDAALNNLLQFGGLEDPTGAANDSSLSIGFLPGVADTSNGPWPGGAPLDYWFRVPSASVDAQRASLNFLLGTLTAGDLSAGPGLLRLPLAIGGNPSTLSLSNARLRARLNATPAPNVPAPPPARLAPGLTVFQSITGSGSGQGICGNVSVESLAHIPVPASLASGAPSACLSCTGSRSYAACSGSTVAAGCNSMLDVLVGGCKTLLCLVTVVAPAQPDVPAPGSAMVGSLSLGSGNAVPSSQSSGNQDAYSSYFKFEANRAHITGLQQ